MTNTARLYTAPDPTGDYDDHYLLADKSGNLSAVKIPITHLFATATAVGIGTATPTAGLDIDTPSLPLHVKLGGTTMLKINDKGVAVGDHTPTGDDDFLRIVKTQNGNTSVIIQNEHAGAASQAVLHLFSEVADLRLATYSNAGGVMANITARGETFNIMQLSAKPMYFYTNSLNRMGLSSAGNLTLGVDTSVDGLREMVIANTNAGASAQAQLGLTSDGPVLRLTVYSKAAGEYANIYASGVTQGLNLLVATNAPLGFWTNATQRMTIVGSGDIGIGNTSPSSLLHLTKASILTSGIQQLLTLGANSTGTTTAGFGSRVQWELQSGSSANQMAGLLDVAWAATGKSRITVYAYDTAAREGLRIEASGTEPKIGLYGVEAVVRQVLATGTGKTADDIITALQNIGLVKQS